MSRTDYRMCVGVDLHKTQLTVCVLNDETGEVEFEGEFRTTDEGYQAFIKRMHELENDSGSRIELAVEATGNARYFKNKMEAEGFGVVVVNTSQFKVITMSTKKNDANDAATLAYYLLKDMLPESHLCDQTSEEIRRMLKTRSILVQATVKMKNQIHGMMLGYGIETKSSQLQSKKKRQELYQDLADHNYSEFTASSLKVILDSLDEIQKQIKTIESQLEKMTAEDKNKELLQTMTGVGVISATTIAAYTKDMNRFNGEFKKFASYLGIVPSVHDSNNTVRRGKITKHGPQELRTALVQVTMGIIRQPEKTSDWKLVVDYHHMKKEKGSGRAIIATTRKVARIVFAMLNNQEEFNPALMIRGKTEQTA
jgi:transposase